MAEQTKQLLKGWARIVSRCDDRQFWKITGYNEARDDKRIRMIREKLEQSPQKNDAVAAAVATLQYLERLFAQSDRAWTLSQWTSFKAHMASVCDKKSLTEQLRDQLVGWPDKWPKWPAVVGGASGPGSPLPNTESGHKRPHSRLEGPPRGAGLAALPCERSPAPADRHESSRALSPGLPTVGSQKTATTKTGTRRKTRSLQLS